jgi:hypothetical protein
MLRPFEAERARHNSQVGCVLIVQACAAACWWRVFGIKALQRMIDMHGCQQIPGMREAVPSPRPRLSP